MGDIDVCDKCKGRDLNGMLFVKFSSIEKRDAAMKMFNVTKSAFNETRMLMNKDLVIQQRAKFSFLINIKKLLIVCAFENVNFDDETGILSVLEVDTDIFTFKAVWLDSNWEQWVELTSDPKFTELLNIAEDKLENAKAFRNKGKEKTSAA